MESNQILCKKSKNKNKNKTLCTGECKIKATFCTVKLEIHSQKMEKQNSKMLGNAFPQPVLQSDSGVPHLTSHFDVLIYAVHAGLRFQPFSSAGRLSSVTTPYNCLIIKSKMK